MHNKSSSMYRVSTAVELAQFAVKQNDIMLSPGFHLSIQKLPLEYIPHAYWSFIEHYGTHYIQQGTLGGRVEYNYVMNKDELKVSYNSTSIVGQCLSVDASAHVVGKSGDNGTGSLHVGYCKNNTNAVSSSSSTASFATNIISNNIGGVSMAALAFSSDSVNEDDRKAFWAGVQQNPGLLTKTVSSICGLIPFSRVNNYQTIQSNCEKGLVSFLRHHGTDGCDSCMNGGMALNIAGSCFCVCPEGSTGDRCEILKGKNTADSEIF